MQYQGIEICCPHCQGELYASSPGGESELACRSCGKVFPIIFGIPDLRVFPDPYIGIAADREKGVKISARLGDLSFVELLDYYYSNTSVVPAQHARLYTRGLLAAESRSHAALETWESTAHKGERRGGKAFLDLGCGTAPLMVAAAQKYEKVVGVDIAFRWLVVARKRLEEGGVQAPLICACAEALPFPDRQFDVVASESAIEHVSDQKQTLAESYRCSRPEASLFLSTPNRFSLGPDPQVGIPAGGYLPDSLVAGIVRRQGGVPPQRRLLSRGSLERLISEAGFSTPEIYLPDIPTGQRERFPSPIRAMIDLYRLARRAPGGRELLLWIGPLLHAVARKETPVRGMAEVELR